MYIHMHIYIWTDIQRHCDCIDSQARIQETIRNSGNAQIWLRGQHSGSVCLPWREIHTFYPWKRKTWLQWKWESMFQWKWDNEYSEYLMFSVNWGFPMEMDKWTNHLRARRRLNCRDPWRRTACLPLCMYNLFSCLHT